VQFFLDFDFLLWSFYLLIVLFFIIVIPFYFVDLTILDNINGVRGRFLFFLALPEFVWGEEAVFLLTLGEGG